MGLVVGKVAATASGADTGDANATGATTKLATEFNYLKHQEILDIIEARKACNGGKGSAAACSEVKRLETLDAQRDATLDACRGDTSAECNNARQEVRTAYADIIRQQDLFAPIDYRLESGQTELKADSTISTIDRLKGGGDGLADAIIGGLADLTKGAIITVKAATGDKEATDKLNQTLDAVARVASTPEQWGEILSHATAEQRDKMAAAYERGDGEALGRIAGDVLSNFVGGGLGTVRKVGNVAGDVVKVAGDADKVVDAAKATKGVGEAYNIAEARKLAEQLTAQSARSPFTAAGTLTQDAINGAKEIIAPGKLSNPAIPSGFGKYATDVFRSPAGDFTMHFYKNPTTGEAFYGLDYKAIFNSMSGR